MNCNVEIRKAERQDVPLLLKFIRGIARYAQMEAGERSASRSTSTTSQHSSDIQDCIWRTCLFGQKNVVKAMERPYCCIW